MASCINVKYIKCDNCGLYDNAINFPDSVNTPELYLETMKKFSCRDDAIFNLGIGIICPSCGNHYEFLCV